MNFGKWIVVAFVLFAGFIGTLVTVCVKQDIPLVTKEYYQEELAYQDQIQRQENTTTLLDEPKISVNKHQLILDYNFLPGIDKGKIKLFRPSDPTLDQDFEISVSGATSQSFEISKPEPGLYKARMTWEQEGKEYFLEKIVVL
jgi:hypothetical protein